MLTKNDHARVIVSAYRSYKSKLPCQTEYSIHVYRSQGIISHPRTYFNNSARPNFASISEAAVHASHPQ